MPNHDRAQRRLNAKRAAKQNRHQLEALRREQAKRERRRFAIVTGIVVLVGMIIVGAVTVPAFLKHRNAPGSKNLASFGAAAASASCDPEVKTEAEPGPADATAKATDDQDRYHLGADKPSWTYKNNPPASGPHNLEPYPTETHYYPPTAAAEPSLVEHLVHNLEHGFIVAWYDDTVAQDPNKLQTLQDIGTNLVERGKNPYFIAAPWPKDRPAMKEGKHVVLASWHAQVACGDISGAALDSFVKAHPTFCAPEDPTRTPKAQIEAVCGTKPSASPSASTPGSASTTVTTTPSPSPSTSASTSPSPSTSASTSPTASASPSAS